MSEVTSIFDLEALAKKRLPGVIFDYVHGGSYEQVTLERNLNDMKALALRQHDMRDVSNRNTAVTMVGETPQDSVGDRTDRPGRADLGQRRSRSSQGGRGLRRLLLPVDHVDLLDRGRRRGDPEAILVPALPYERAEGEREPDPPCSRGGLLSPGSDARSARPGQALGGRQEWPLGPAKAHAIQHPRHAAACAVAGQHGEEQAAHVRQSAG